MQWLKAYSRKLIVGLVAASIAMSGAALQASDVKTSDKAAIMSKAAGMTDVEQKDDAARLKTLREISWFLSKMDNKDLAATLKLMQVTKLIQLKHVEDVGADKLLTGALKGEVSSLGDPHSIYMDAELYKKLSTEMKGSFGGVGIVLGSKDNVLTVVAPIEDTPGARAGIKSGDQIVKIDGTDTKDMVLDEAVNLIRGDEGTSIILTIKRAGQEAQDYNLVRSNIELKTVSGKMLEDGIGYVRLTMFNEHTGGDLIKKLQELEGQGMKAVVLDLRNNPGGLLQEGVKVANQFVPQGPIVSVITKDGTKTTYSSKLEAVKYPLAVLVNSGSASASEIVAGAVQDTKVGVLIGTKTYGKGSVQNIVPLGDETAVKLTTAKYLTPADRSINGIGIEPDIKVEMPEYKENGKDLQLDKAIEILKEKLSS